jgi:hypothetical protein
VDADACESAARPVDWSDRSPAAYATVRGRNATAVGEAERYQPASATADRYPVSTGILRN